MEISPYGSKDEESLDICRVEKSRRICVLKLLKITKVLIRYGFILFFSRFELRTVTVILWESDKPVSSAHEFWKLWTEFVNFKSIFLRFSSFLKHVGTWSRFSAFINCRNPYINVSLFCIKVPHKKHFIIIC